MDPRQLLTDEWKTVERLIAATCRRRGIVGADADIFASMVKVKLFENDCEIVRRFRGESKFSTYLNIVVQNTFMDFSVRRVGKWHPSAAATRGGALALELERLIYRDGYSQDEAITRLQTANPAIKREQLLDLVRKLPVRNRRFTTVSMDAMELDPSDSTGADVLVISNERRQLSDRVASVIRDFLRRLAPSDRLMLQFHFESGMQLSQIARILGIEQKPLYRRREQLLRQMKDALAAASITSAEVADLIGNITEDWDIGLRNEELSPSEDENGPEPHAEFRR
jgi:RNA polymerase sigma factor (sigma-70 family)